MARVLVLTGGPDHAHDYDALGASLTWVIEGGGHEIIGVFDDPDAAADRLRQGDVDVLAINALRWRMHGERYDAWRDEWAYSTPASTRAAIAGFVAAGGGLFGNHTASICFDDWPEWGDVLGGSWVWDHSSHPPAGLIAIDVEPRADDPHPVTAGLPRLFHLDDEVYGDLDLRVGIEPLAWGHRSSDDRAQPLVWAHRYGEGRVVYDGLGHDARSLNDAVHVRLIRNAVDWVARSR